MFFISTLLGSASRMHVESLGKPCDVNKCPGILDIKGIYLVFSIYDVASGNDIPPCNKIDKPFVVYRFW